MKKLLRHFAQQNIEATPLSPEEAAARLKEWVLAYSGGENVSGQCPLAWELFANGASPCVEGDQARNSYRGLSAAEYYVLGAEAGRPSFRCVGPRLPNFEGKFLDLLVVPEDYGWTMAFCHEPMGPYFSELGWVKAGRAGV